MTDFTALDAEAQKLVDAQTADLVAVIADLNAESDSLLSQIHQWEAEAQRQKDLVASVQAAFDAYKASHPDAPPPVVIPPIDPVPTGTIPGPNGEGTGYSGTLTASGSITANTKGQVIQNKRITGALTINAADVVVKNCEILGSVGAWGSNLLMEDCSVNGQNKVVDGIFGYGTFRRCKVINCVNGITVGGSNTVIDGNFISTLGNSTTPNPHYDCVAMHGGDASAGGLKNVTVKNNRLIARDTSAVFIADDFAPIDNVTVDHNHMSGKPSACVYSVSRHTHVQGVKITNNICEPGAYGYYFTITNSGTVTAGNVDAKTGVAI